nr:MAG TPA: septicolysin [Caudoviricetes sp.]
MAEMTITRALSRAKVIKKRLDELSREAFVGYVRKAEAEKLGAQQYAKNSQSCFDEYQSLLKEYVAIKTAIHQFNDTKEVTIPEFGTFTVARLLVEKSILEERRKVYRNIREQNRVALNTINEAEEDIASSVSKYLATQDKQLNAETTSKEFLEDLANKFKEAKQKELEVVTVSGFDHLKYLEEEGKRIELFTAEIDTILSEVNATNIIKVTF